MTRFLLKRLALSFVTLILLSVIVFAASQLLPGDIGRNVLGPFASPANVVKFNHEHGVDRPIWTQYWDWISHFARGDLGTSLQYGVSVGKLLGPSLVNSLKLAAVAFVFVVPLSLLGGTVAALRRNRVTDRVITVTGLSLTSIPEFVTAIVLIVVFGVVLKWLPVSATAPAQAGFFTQVKFLLLPSFALVAVLLGYIARITRAGVGAVSPVLPVPAPSSESKVARRETLGQLAHSKTFIVGAVLVTWWVLGDRSPLDSRPRTRSPSRTRS